MPDFAPNQTHRYVAKYVSAGLTHEVLYRETADSAPSEVILRAQTLFTGIQTLLHVNLPTDFAWVSAKFCGQFDVIFAPVAPPAAGTAGAIDPLTMSHMNRACELNFIGRSVSTPISMAFFGYFLPLDDPDSPASNGRVTSGEDSHIAAVIARLAAETHLVAVNGQNPRWSAYANYKVNDHWLRIARRTQL